MTVSGLGRTLGGRSAAVFSSPLTPHAVRLWLPFLTCGQTHLALVLLSAFLNRLFVVTARWTKEDHFWGRNQHGRIP
jgi:hypothetical protein